MILKTLYYLKNKLVEVKHIFITILSICVGTSSLWAQEVGRELTLSQAIGYALQHKANAQKAQIEVRKSEYKIKEARANALPTIAGSAGLVYNPKLQATYIDGSAFAFPGMPVSNEHFHSSTRHMIFAASGLLNANWDKLPSRTA